jgi:GT2 family glycosyltransferase
VSAIANALEGPEEVIVVEEPRNGSPAAARNRGVQRAAHEIIVFVDADVEVAPDAFVHIRQAFDAPALAAVFGSYDDSPDHPALVSGFRNLLHHHVHQQAAGPAVTFWAGLGAIRKGAFVASGGFDEGRFRTASVEDIDLGMRLAADGWAIRLDPTIQGKHLKSWTLTEMVRTDLLRRGIPWVQLLIADDRARNALNLGWRHRISAMASVTLVAALPTRRRRQALLPLLILLALNRDFYALVLRKRGRAAAAAAVPLHIIHHLTSAAAVPLGVAAKILDWRKGRAR